MNHINMNDDIKLWHGDCLELMKDIPDKSISLVITDPPYWHKKSPGKPYSQRNQCHTKSKFSNSNLYSQDGYMMKAMSDFNQDSISTMMKELSRVCKILNAYIFCNETQVPYYAMWAEKNRYMFSILIWRKPLSIINKNRFSQNVEFIIRIYDYGTGLNRIDKNYYYDRVKDVKPISGKNKLHPVQKPLELINQIMELSSKEGDTVLDPFMGSGTTGVACINTGRKFIGIELDNNYFDIANKRIKDAIINKQTELF